MNRRKEYTRYNSRTFEIILKENIVTFTRNFKTYINVTVFSFYTGPVTASESGNKITAF